MFNRSQFWNIVKQMQSYKKISTIQRCYLDDKLWYLLEQIQEQQQNQFKKNANNIISLIW